MNSRFLSALLLGVAVFLNGCAHPIAMVPKMSDLDVVQARKSDKAAAYYISEQDRIIEVTTPGGGGDKVSYKPYADIEYGLDRVLSKKYAAVYALKEPNDTKFISEKKIAYIFYPKLVTNSKSTSMFTWPPTEFTIEMECVANDSIGSPIWKKTVHGTGNSEFSEFKSNYSLSAERASTQVLLELMKEIDSEKVLQ